MHIIKKPTWAIPEREATPEAVFLNRRKVLAGMGMGAGLIAAGGVVRPARAEGTPIDGLFPASRNFKYRIDGPPTPEADNTHYNNFYEFGTSKSIADAAEALKPWPWQVTIDGMVAKPRTLDVADLVRAMPVEERLYRHRCVEAWSMTVPWTGFPLAALVAYAEPTADARYVRFETFNDPDMAPGLSQFFYPWPYVEGLTLDEARNDLAFMVIGAYGKPLPKSMGAPLRLATPWKYGFKSAKSLVKISFVAERPVNFWQQLQASEYGFWANVNPQVPHPRWSQATERVLHTGERIPTRLFNGYADEVAGLYKGLEGEALYM